MILIGCLNALSASRRSRAADARHNSMAQSLLMKIVSERRADFHQHLSAAPRQC
jgi:hypothetical protein